MDERQTTRSSRGGSRKGRGQQNLIAFAVIAVVLLLIGGIIGSAMQSGKAKKAVNELSEATGRYTQEIAQKDERIATLEAAIADKQKEIDELRSGAATGAPITPDDSAPTDTESGEEGQQKSGGSLFGTFLIIFIIVILVGAAVYVSYNAFKKKAQDDDDEDDDDYDDDEDEDYDDEDDGYSDEDEDDDFGFDDDDEE